MNKKIYVLLMVMLFGSQAKISPAAVSGGGLGFGDALQLMQRVMGHRKTGDKEKRKLRSYMLWNAKAGNPPLLLFGLKSWEIDQFIQLLCENKVWEAPLSKRFRNYYHAMLYVQSILDRDGGACKTFTVDDLKNIHAYVMTGEANEFAGERAFRDVPEVVMKGSLRGFDWISSEEKLRASGLLTDEEISRWLSHRGEGLSLGRVREMEPEISAKIFDEDAPSSCEEITAAVTDLIAEIRVEGDIMIKAPRIFKKLMKIHPWIDGNGRVGLLVLNMMLADEERDPIAFFRDNPFINYDTFVFKLLHQCDTEDKQRDLFVSLYSAFQAVYFNEEKNGVSGEISRMASLVKKSPGELVAEWGAIKETIR